MSFTRALLPRLSGPTTIRTFSASARSNVAKITLIGRLPADPEFSLTQGGTEMAKYTVGSDYRQQGESKTQWFKVVSFGDSSKSYLETIKKGTLVYVDGDLSMNTYEGADGKKHSSVNVIQRNIKVLKRPSSPNEEEM